MTHVRRHPLTWGYLAATVVAVGVLLLLAMLL